MPEIHPTAFIEDGAILAPDVVVGPFVFIGSEVESSLPLLEMKFVEGENMIYVCLNKSCRMPVSTVSDALQQFE